MTFTHNENLRLERLVKEHALLEKALATNGSDHIPEAKLRRKFDQVRKELANALHARKVFGMDR